MPKFKQALSSSETWGSKWHQTQIQTMLENL